MSTPHVCTCQKPKDAHCCMCGMDYTPDCRRASVPNWAPIKGFGGDTFAQACTACVRLAMLDAVTVAMGRAHTKIASIGGTEAQITDELDCASLCLRDAIAINTMPACAACDTVMSSTDEPTRECRECDKRFCYDCFNDEQERCRSCEHYDEYGYA